MGSFYLESFSRFGDLRTDEEVYPFPRILAFLERSGADLVRYSKGDDTFNYEECIILQKIGFSRKYKYFCKNTREKDTPCGFSIIRIHSNPPREGVFERFGTRALQRRRRHHQIINSVR